MRHSARSSSASASSRARRRITSRPSPMSSDAKIYCVGGAVRDQLLGLPVQDRDWVVVGSTPEMTVAQGFPPVGKDFPVFLHPETHEEYTLARTERTTARGYPRLAVYAAPDVTLEQDLLRRDFTINAIAQDADGKLIDPHNGIADLRAGILRHVSAAFGEDPVRILRAARFAARFGFSIAPETLRSCGALAKILPEVDALFGVPQPENHHPEIDCGLHTLLVADDTARHGHPLEVRFAALMHDLGKATTPKDILPRHTGHEQRGVELIQKLAQRLRVPSDCRDLALLAARYHGDIHRARELRAETVIKLFQSADAWRRPERFAQLLQACTADAHGRSGHEQDDYPQADYLLRLLAAARAVDAGEIAAHCTDPAAIPARVRRARVAAIADMIREAGV